MNSYIFIDESGSPQFYAKRKRPLWMEPDFVPLMFLGMVITPDRVKLREAIVDFQSSILDDPLLNSIFSVSQPGWYLHARNDHSDINLKTVELLRRLKGFTFSAVIGRKIPEIFVNKHNGNATEFYFDMVHKLLELGSIENDCNYHFYLSQRQSNTEQRFRTAVEKALKVAAKEAPAITYSCTIVRSRDFPELSVVDYLLWALQRYIIKGERRYFTALEHHYTNILDVYENEGVGKIYTAEEPFDLGKASRFTIGQ